MLTVVQMLNGVPVWLLWIFQILFCYLGLLLLLRTLGRFGVMLGMTILLIAGNIQVLKAVQFPFYSAPIPLGTVFLATTYLASDILAEYFGSQAAKQAITISVVGFVIMTLCMLLTMGFHPLTHAQAVHFGLQHVYDYQAALLMIFSPALKMLLCSIVSFWISQRLEISLFMAIRRLTGEKALWLRNNISTWTAALVDNTFFTVIIFHLWTAHPVPWHTLIFGYVGGTYIMRVLMALLDTPFIYWAGRCLGKSPSFVEPKSSATAV